MQSQLKVIHIDRPITIDREDIRPTRSGTGYYISLRVEADGLIRHPDGTTTRVKLTGWWNPTIRAILDVE